VVIYDSIAPVSCAGLVEAVSTTIRTRLDDHAGHCLDSLIPAVAVGVSLDLGRISVSLAVLSPCAASSSVATLHICAVTVLLYVVAVATGIVTVVVGCRPVAICKADRGRCAQGH
jgi:hypothetical protein